MKSKYQLFPITDEIGWNFYQTQIQSFWTAQEISLEHEKNDFKTLNKDAQQMLVQTLAFFAASDLVVNDRLTSSIMKERMSTEMLMAYQTQIFFENIHTETYNLLIDTLVTDDELKLKLFNSLENYPTIGAKRDWYIKNSDENLPIAHRLIVQVCVEGIHFSSSFALIAWLRKYAGGKFKGTTTSNDLIMRDEALHAKMSLALFNRLSDEKKNLVDIEKVITEAVMLEIDFVKSAYKNPVLGMNADLMTSHVRFIGNYWSKILLDKNIFPCCTKPVFDWLVDSTLQTKTNFFEQRPTEYARPKESMKICFDAEF